ncbi:hypothetical protein SETIT_2G063500v2 [Setaria italica]|uniref:F-box domain-containing protein n=1 Tax=Setaria italica TaxID=4555 RepID=A0A368PW84_SETIT|nr:hypothetical protein SETIT_2G063500v2 [Setaria italica]
MDCPRGSAVAGLYDDILVEILSRVPVKDLRRSKCVSKPWRDLISDPLHRKKLPQTLEGFFHGGRRSFGHFTCLTGTGESVPPVDLDPSFSFLTEKLPGVERLVLLDSCNGLLLFGCNREDRFGYIVCNPATEECVDVPASSCSCPPPPPFGESNDVYNGERYAHTFLIFDPAASVHFHLVQFWNDAWSDRASKWKRGEKGGEWGQWGQAMLKFTFGRAFINGLLYFIVYHVQKSEALILACISMDLQLKGFRIYFTQLSVWVLEDNDTQEWILKHNVSCSQLFGFLSCPAHDLDIVAIHPDHNSVIFVQRWNRKLVLYNMDTKELHPLRSL